MKLFRTRFAYLYICFSFFLAAALWYTEKIDCLDRAGELKEAGRAPLDFWDVPILLLDMGSSGIPSDGALAAALPSLVLSGAGNE